MTDREIELAIDDVAYGGDGVGRHEGKAVFVPFTIGGERVRVRLVEARSRFARGEVTEILEASPHRVTPPCGLYGQCGGCCYQHIAYAHQREIKTKQLRDALVRIGKLEDMSVVGEVMVSPSSYGYRNKITLHGRDGVSGFVARDQRTLLAVETCPLASDAINACLADPERDRQVRGQVALRSNARGKIWVYDAREPGQATIEDRIGDTAFRVPLGGFFQINPGMTAILAAWLKARVATDEATRLIDAYCGVGVFGLLVCPPGAQLVGIERNTAAVRAARHNAKQAGLDKARFVEGSAAEHMAATLREALGKKTCVVLDPPRAGCEPEVLDGILTCPPVMIAYVSCNPPALARDVRRLSERYRVAEVAGFDMFPQTAPFEAVAILVRR